MKIMISIGTRPEIIKMAPLIRLIEDSEHDLFLLHSNQHYDKNMDEIFFKEFEIRKPDINLNIGSMPHGAQSAKIIMGVEKYLSKEKPDIVLVHGDTNTTLGTSIAVSKSKSKLAHVEAGLRSYDRSMPEEINRIVADHISDFCFSPTEIQSKILVSEGIDSDKIYEVGNTISDSIKFLFEKDDFSSDEIINNRFNYNGILTLHRPSNVDNSNKLMTTLNLINQKLDEINQTILFPCHPRTRKNIPSFNDLKNIEIIEPIGYFEFIKLLKTSKFVLTDSGGIQEEASILGVPCITIRKNTERPETLKINSNKLWTSQDYNDISSLLNWAINNKKNWKNPYGSGDCSQKIFHFIKQQI